MKIVFSKVIVLVKNLFWFLIRTSNIARKTKFYSSRRPEKMVFPKKSWWNMIFLVLSGKMIFLFSKNMILPLDGKWKMIFLKKKYTEIWYFLQMFWKDGLFKRDYYAGLWSLLYYLERWYFFPKTWYFFLGQEARDDLSQEIHGNMIFPVYTYGCYKRGVTPLCQKKSKMVLSRKRDLKVVDVLDWHPRKGSSNSLYFHGDLYERFHVFLSCEKTENSIYRSEVWLLLQFIRLEIFYNE